MYKLIGFKKYDFVGGPHNNRLKGVRLFVEYEGKDSKTFGCCPETVTVSDEKLTELGLISFFNSDELIGEQILVFYNRYGRVECVQFPNLSF